MSSPRRADIQHKENTSDHAYQSARVVLLDSKNNPLLQLRGATWNMMNRCRSRATTGSYNNNPWNYDETPTEYLDRVRQQLQKIIDVLLNGDEGIKHFMFLQEVNFWFWDFARDKSLLPQDQKRCGDLQKQLQRDFQAQLAKHGYELVMSEKPKDGAGQKYTVTIYNTKILKKVGVSQGILHVGQVQPDEGDAYNLNKYTGSAQDFTVVGTDQVVTLANLHLEYSHDYSADIPAYQSQQIKNNKLTIMAGDTNHAPNHGMTGFINNWHNVTNISSDGGKKLTHKHAKSDVGAKKCYDGFFVSPTQNTKAVITEITGEVFEESSQQSGVFNIRKLDPKVEYAAHRQHRTKLGKAWVKGAFKAEEMVKGKESSTAEVAGILKKKSAPKGKSKTKKVTFADDIDRDIVSADESHECKGSEDMNPEVHSVLTGAKSRAVGTKKKVTTPADSSAEGYICKESLDAIQKTIGANWNVPAYKPGQERVTVTNKADADETFDVEKRQLVTESENADTYEAMLKSLKAVSGDQVPVVTTYSEEAKAAWEAAYAKVYPEMSKTHPMLIKLSHGGDEHDTDPSLLPRLL